MSLASQFNQVQLLLVRYELPFILVFGTLGNLLNIMVFSRRALRTNVCSWYFICLSVTHLLQLNIIALIQIVAISTNYDLAAQSLVFCKIRQYAFDLIMILSRHFLCLIAIDRWMVTSSNAWLRQLSSPHIARWMLLISVIFWAVFGIHSFTGVSINFNLCIATPASTYQLFYSIYSMVISIVPIVIMVIFSLLALHNVRMYRKRRIQPMVIVLPSSHHAPQSSGRPLEIQRSRHRRDGQLIRLSIFQAMIYVLFNAVWAISPLFGFITTARGNRTVDERLWSAFLVGFGFNLIFTYTALTFPIYTLASSRFRREFIQMIKECLNAIRPYF